MVYITSAPLALLVLGAASVLSARQRTPLGYEVKFTLLDSALNNGTPSADVVSTFNLQSPPEERTWAYFDTDNKTLNAEGWVARIRHKEGDNLTLTYKKRFPVNNGLDAALAEAKQYKFKKGAEIDWTTEKQTLSYSEDKVQKKVSRWLNGTTIPCSEWALCLLVHHIPDKLEDWKQKDWGKDVLMQARQYGPVTGKVWFGNWNNTEVRVEVLPIKNQNGTGTELNTELSFDANEQNASDLRDKAMRELENRGWLDRNGKLKTGTILDRY